MQDIYNQKLMISTTYQQTLMLALILGRWVLPKGGLTRDELSQLLLVYIGIGADMLEFSSETMKLEGIACRRGIFTAILCVWSWSTLQFTLCLTLKKRRRRIQVSRLNSRLFTGLNELTAYLSHAEIWSLMTDVILQDGPYLATRLYILLNFDVVNQSLIFFTCKNILLIFLQFYRMYVVIHESRGQRRKNLEADRVKNKNIGLEANGSGNGAVAISVAESSDLEYELDSCDEDSSHRQTPSINLAIYAISANMGLAAVNDVDLVERSPSNDS